jgi:hypothetical protein
MVFLFTFPIFWTVVSRQFAPSPNKAALLYPQKDSIGTRVFFRHPFDIRVVIMIDIFSVTSCPIVTKVVRYMRYRGAAYIWYLNIYTIGLGRVFQAPSCLSPSHLYLHSLRTVPQAWPLRCVPQRRPLGVDPVIWLGTSPLSQ